MQQTETYKLNLIEMGDALSTEPLNENTRKMEEMLHGRLCFSYGTYTGDGAYGSAHPKRLEFDFKPLALVLGYDEEDGGTVWLRGVECGRSGFTTTSNNVTGISEAYVTWEDRGVRWYSDHYSPQFNVAGGTYYYLCIGVQE